jgi:tetratricopeptide (TPR) repeat protein
MIHYDDEALLMYAEGTSPLREEITVHVASCEQCAGMLSAHQELAALLKSTDVWEPVAAPTAEVVARGRQLATVSRRIEHEDEASIVYVDELLGTPPAWWRTKVMRDGQRSIGVVHQLLERARQKQSQVPLEAVTITKLAIEVADNLPIAEYPSDLVYSIRGHAHREHAYVLYLLGRLPEALAMTDTAAELFGQTAMPEYELARVDLMRAHVFSDIDRVTEAITLARRASETFDAFGDRRRYVNARITAGSMLFANSQTRDALEIWLSVVNDPAIEDVPRLMVVNNLALCYRELGDYERACEFLSTVIAEYEILGMEALKAKSRNSLGSALMKAGRHDAAVSVFEQTWKEFEHLGMETEAALAALELAEALLIAGRAERVPHICRTLLDRFTSAGMTSRAITALAFLREAVAIGQAQPTLVRHVYDFLREIPVSPQRASAHILARLED